MISDSLGGALSEAWTAGLDRHLTGCASCRAYRREAALIQENAGGVADPCLGPEAWADFGRRLDAKLASTAAPSPGALGRDRAVLRRPKWAMAATAFVALAFVVFYFAVLRHRTGAEPGFVPFEDSLAQVLGEVGASPGLESSLNQAIMASIAEAVQPAGEDVPISFGDNPLFWESLTEGELVDIESALAREKGLGGVS
jgi:hypothetical protein